MLDDIPLAPEEQLEGVETKEAPIALPINLLVPKSDLHTRMLEHLNMRIDFSEREMGAFYDRWEVNERKTQAYISLPKYENVLRKMTDSGEPPNPTSIQVPYIFSTVLTVVTYLVHTFCGRKPMFQVGTSNSQEADKARMMETVLQFNADHVRLIRHLFQMFMDGEIYGVGILRTLWKVEKKNRTVWKTSAATGALMPGLPPQPIQTKEERIVYEGNDVISVDPFMFFPDPRVPMVEVNRRGEFVAWRSYEGKHTLKKAEQDGLLKWVDHADTTISNRNGELRGRSIRNLRAKGQSSPGDLITRGREALPFYQVDQISIELNPSEFGISEEKKVEKWLFTILNRSQIVQAEPLDLDHDMHPVAVEEPYSFGYGFGQMGLADILGPIQDIAAWFLNSHIHNVRSALNNQLIVDPSMIEMQDLKKPGPGRIIRLKQSAYGQDVRTAIQQLQIQDVTTNHVSDLRDVIRLGDGFAAVDDNTRGIQEAGGRKTATEVRTSSESGASRLAAHARLISAQAMCDLTEQMCVNIQQNMTQTFYLTVVGIEGIAKPLQISPEMIVGDFHYPVSDGTLPIDKLAFFELWQQVLTIVATSPVLSQQYDLSGIFQFMIELGGATNISQFKLQPGTPQAAIQQQAMMVNGQGGTNGAAPPGPGA